VQGVAQAPASQRSKEGKEMDVGSDSSDSSSVRNASKSSLKSSGVLKSKSKLGRRNLNSKQGSSACRLRRQAERMGT
jgi:hypothetical protein